MGEFALVRTKRVKGKKEDWLLIKKKDFAVRPGWDPESDIRSVLQAPADPSAIEGTVKAAMPTSLEPMLATLTDPDALPSGSGWLFEVKWDGYRALCFIAEKKIRMLSRRGNPMEKQFSEVAKALLECVNADSALIDGEVVALDENGVPSFQLLQNRTGFHKSAAVKDASSSLSFYAFDLLYLNGYDLRGAALIDRRQLLKTILLPSEVVRYSDHFAGKGQELMAAVREKGMEGIVAKQAQSKYESRRSGQWLKIKVASQQDFVICGFILGEREPFGSLVLGYYKDKKLVYAGNVGSGFNQASLKSTYEAMEPLITSKAVLSDVPREIGKVAWVKPELVCVVKFNAWTADERLRAPVFQGMRADAEPKDVVREIADQPAASAATEPETKTTLKKEPLLPAGQTEASLTVQGRQLKFTNLKKVFYPADGYTKGDLINYYAAVADLLVPHLAGRPLSLKRYPDGIEKEFFFQKAAAASFPDWLHTEEIATSEDSTTRFVICDDKASLLYLANLGCIDQNPWMSRVGSLDEPDFILIDLDPYHCGYDQIMEAAQLVKRKLDLIGLQGYPKTTGGDGMHVYVPVTPGYSYEHTRNFAQILSHLVVAERPELFTTPRNVAARQKGKVYFDWMQNAEGKTISAPYVLRAYPGAPVATPLSWDEVKPGLKPQQFHIGNVLRRFERVGDLFAGVLRKPQEMEKALEKISQMVGKK